MSNNKNPFADHLGIKVIEVQNGMARVRVTVEAHHANHHGYAHGGFLYSVADFAFELASNSYGIPAVGIATNMFFHRPSPVGSVLEAVAAETHLGKSVATYRVDVYSKEKLIAAFMGTVHRKSTIN
jgi:acyl-CoA thioesterase